MVAVRRRAEHQRRGCHALPACLAEEQASRRHAPRRHPRGAGWSSPSRTRSDVAEATTLAAASHAALEREWQTTSRRCRSKEIAELSADLDTATQAAAAPKRHAQELRAAEMLSLKPSAEAAAAVAAEQAAARREVAAGGEAAAGAHRGRTLRETLNLLHDPHSRPQRPGPARRREVDVSICGRRRSRPRGPLQAGSAPARSVALEATPGRRG